MTAEDSVRDGAQPGVSLGRKEDIQNRKVTRIKTGGVQRPDRLAARPYGGIVAYDRDEQWNAVGGEGCRLAPIAAERMDGHSADIGHGVVAEPFRSAQVR